jgi:non-homologous end joining protein Ku
MRRIKEKIRKNQVHEPAAETPVEKRPKAEVIDLMDALKKSLALRGNAVKGRKRSFGAVCARPPQDSRPAIQAY